MITQIQIQPELPIKLGKGKDTELINERTGKAFYGLRRIQFKCINKDVDSK